MEASLLDLKTILLPACMHKKALLWLRPNLALGHLGPLRFESISVPQLSFSLSNPTVLHYLPKRYLPPTPYQFAQKYLGEDLIG
jgi:hypothetical protein